VWRELERALAEPRPGAFFDTLADCGALAVVMPELAPLWAAPASGVARDAPAGQASGAQALQVAATAGETGPVRFAALLASLPVAQIESLCARLRAPNDYRELALLAARLGEKLHGGGAPPPALARDPAWLLDLLEGADACRRPERFEAWLRVLRARAIAGGVPLAAAEELAATLGAAAACAAAVRLDPAELAGLEGGQIAARLRTRRLEALAAR
jgi:tRNA nucleotidyltransferase (CCA-adding enzyme)